MAVERTLAIVKPDGVEKKVVGKIVDRILEEFGDFHGVLGLGQRILLQSVGHQLAEKGDPGEILHERVVQVLADAALLAVADLKEILFESASFEALLAPVDETQKGDGPEMQTVADGLENGPVGVVG